MYVVGEQHADINFTINPPINGLHYEVSSTEPGAIGIDMGNPDDLSGVFLVGDTIPTGSPTMATANLVGLDSQGTLKATDAINFTVTTGSGGPNFLVFSPVLV